MTKQLLEKRGRLAKRLSEIQNMENLTPELRTEIDNTTKELGEIAKQIEERKAIQSTIDTASQPVNFTAPDANLRKSNDSIITASMPRDLKVFTSKRFGSADVAGKRAYDAGQWFLAALKGSQRAAEYCRQNGLEIRTITEGDNASAGSLVPSPLSSTIIELITEYGVMRNYCQREIMTSDVLTVSKRTGGATAYWPGESGSITASSPTWKPVTITAKKMAALVKYSSEASEDAIVSIADKVMMECGVAFAFEEDDAIINGDGGSTYGGINGLLSAAAAGATKTAASDHDSAAEITDSDILDGIAGLARYTRNKVIFTSAFFQNAVFTRLARAAGGVTMAEFTGIGFVPTYAGIPIVVCNAFPTTDGATVPYAIVGDLSQSVVWGDRRNITFKRLVELYAATDEEAIQATQRFGATVHDVGTSSAAGAYVRLNTYS